MMELEQILTYCDHTLLKPEAKASEVRKACDEAIRFNCASVCVPPCHVAGARRYVQNRMRICTVVGFPHGTATTAVKVFETKDAIHNGADEIDMVVNLSMVKDGCWAEVANDIRSVRNASEGAVLKVIIESASLRTRRRSGCARSWPTAVPISSRPPRDLPRGERLRRMWSSCAQTPRNR